MNPQKVLIIAEAGVNHNGSLDMALQLVEAAAEAGADAVKFQTFQTEKVVSPFAPKAKYQECSAARGETQYEMLRRLEIPQKVFKEIYDFCKNKEISFLSTPDEKDSLLFLVRELGLQTIKIGSGEITNAPFLLDVAREKVSVILSTGMSTLGEVEQALGCLAFGYLNEKTKPSLESFTEALSSPEGQNILEGRVTLLHCTSEYPAPIEDVNLKAIFTLKQAFGLPVGYSDHTQSLVIPAAAVALGATVIEKHFTLDRTLPGPDHQASLNPDEMQNMIINIRSVEKALGNGRKFVTPSEKGNRFVVRRSLIAARDIEQTDILKEDDIDILRPARGKPPIEYWSILGKKAGKNVQKGQPL